MSNLKVQMGRQMSNLKQAEQKHKALIISTNEKTPANEIAQPAISQKNGKIPPRP